MKKILSSVAMAALLSSPVLADEGYLTISAEVEPYATVSITNGPLDASHLIGENDFIDSIVNLGVHVPNAFGPKNADVYAISNKVNGEVALKLTGNGDLINAINGNTIPMAYSYAMVGGASMPVATDGTPFIVTYAPDGSKVGTFTATPTVAATTPAGAYVAVLEAVVTAE